MSEKNEFDKLKKDEFQFTEISFEPVPLRSFAPNPIVEKAVEKVRFIPKGRNGHFDIVNIKGDMRTYKSLEAALRASIKQKAPNISVGISIIKNANKDPVAIRLIRRD